MKSRSLQTLATTVLVLCCALPAAADHCVACHGAPSFKVQHKAAYDYYADFENSIHGVAGLACTDCHGGDADTNDMVQAHQDVLTPLRYDQIPVTCGQCHDEQREAFVTSDHYRQLETDGTAPNCVTCHGAMDMDVIYVNRVSETCTLCHNPESGIFPDVPDQADDILGEINVMKGYRSFVAANLQDRETVATLDAQYLALTAKWHRFDLDSIRDETRDLLGDYRQAKGQALKDRRQRHSE